MNITTWNTNRQYTANGQRIAALPLQDERVVFYDVDLSIFGVTIGSWPKEFCDLKRFVMFSYDSGSYEEDMLHVELPLHDKCKIRHALKGAFNEQHVQNN